MNMYFHELRAYRKSTIIWTLSLVGLVILFMSMFPSFTKDAAEFRKLLEGYPEPVRKAIGLELENVFSILGYYSYAFVYITLCGAIQAMNLGTSVVSKEVREKTADFLLTKPVTRTKVIAAKLLAALTSLIITNVFYIFATGVILSKVQTEDYSYKIFFLITIALFFIQLMFLALGFIVSVSFSKIKTVLTVSLGTVFAFFMIGMLVSTSNGEGKRYLSPFKYFESNYIIENGHLETSFVIAAIIIIIVSIVASFVVYQRKDIDAV